MDNIGMTRLELDLYLDDLESWRTATEFCRERFGQEMRHRRYGPTDTAFAWFWFCAGWTAHSRE